MITKNGVVLLEKKGLYTVYCDGESVSCRAGSRLRKSGVRLLAGDVAEIEQNDDGTGFIVGIKERKNSLIRPRVANVELFVIVTATCDPMPFLYNLDKLTVMAAVAGIETVFAVNKSDLASPETLCGLYESAGMKCFPICATDGNGVEALKNYIKGKTVVFAGASGVGKSSLINALYPALDAEIGELSQKIARGKNTTRHTEFYLTEDRTLVADTPGFTMLDSDRLGVTDKKKLWEYFPEFENHNCRFRGCTHLKEEGCSVIEDVKNGKTAKSRHESYCKLYGELAAMEW